MQFRVVTIYFCLSAFGLREFHNIQTHNGPASAGSFDPNPHMAKVFTIPVVPRALRRRRTTVGDNRYVEGQRMIVEAMKYLAQADPKGNRAAVEFLSEHFRTKFRMSDSPIS